MKKPKAFLYIIYLLFIGLSLVFIFFTDSIFDQFGIQKTLNFLQYWAIFGIVLFLFEIIYSNMSLQSRRSENNRLKKENESLKARIYDIEAKDREVDESMKSFGNSLKTKPENKSGIDENDSI